MYGKINHFSHLLRYKLQSRTHPKASVSDLYSESSLLLCISSLNHLRKCLAVAETVAVAPAASAAAAVEGMFSVFTVLNNFGCCELYMFLSY